MRGAGRALHQHTGHEDHTLVGLTTVLYDDFTTSITVSVMLLPVKNRARHVPENLFAAFFLRFAKRPPHNRDGMTHGP